MEIDSLPLLIKKCKLKQIDAFFLLKISGKVFFFFYDNAQCCPGPFANTRDKTTRELSEGW